MTLRIHFLCRRKHFLAPIEWLGNNVYFMYYPLRVTHKEFIRGGEGCVMLKKYFLEKASPLGPTPLLENQTRGRMAPNIMFPHRRIKFSLRVE